jgi:class 3 adenylate cyclase
VPRPELKVDPALRHIPVLMISALDEMDTVIRCIELGAEDYLAKIIMEHEGTVERFAGDGIMIFFNDPVVVPNPGERAIRMAVAIRDRVQELSKVWRRRGHQLGVGIGIAQGYATIGAIGFEGRWDYGAIGTVTNFAARLCGEAKAGQILAATRVADAVEDIIESAEVEPVTLKGFHRKLKDVVA